MNIEWIAAPAENFAPRTAVCDMSHGVALHHFGWVDEPNKPRRYVTADGAISWFRAPHPNRPTSAHFVIAEERVVQMVPLTAVAYHAGPMANGVRIGIEHDPRWSDKTYETGALLTAALLRLAGLPADSNTIRPHNSFGATACPGTCDVRRYLDAVRDTEARLKRLDFFDIVRQLTF